MRTCLCLLLMLGTGVCTAQTTFYVATAGNDEWSGTVASPNRARTDGPFATLSRARNAIRELKAEGPLSAKVQVLVREGTYFLTEPLVFSGGDSGTEQAPVSYAAMPGQKVSLRGSQPIADWQPYRGSIYQAKLTQALLASGAFWQLYYKGQRQALARFPNFDPKHPRSGGFSYVPSVVEKGSKTLLAYNPDKLNPTKWTKPSEVRVHVWSWLNWNRSILPIQEIDTSKQIITLGKPASYMISLGNRFFVENALEELDAPGEWYCDRTTGMLYFWPPDGKHPGNQVSVPVLPTLMKFEGAKDRFVSNVQVSGFDLCETRGGLVTMSYANHCALTASTLRHCGGNAVVIDKSSHHNRVAGCDIAHVGGTAVTLSDERDWTHQPEGHLAYNVIDNNHVHDVGEYGDAWGAIRFDPSCGGNASHGNVVSHNLVHDTPRQGISFNGMGNIVEYNHVHHTNQEQSDTGAIGMGSRDIYERGSVIRYNYIHDTGGYNMVKPGVWEYPHYCWGVYLDDYTSGVHVYGNLIVRTYRGGVMIHGGQDNRVENNIIVDGQAYQLQYAPIDSLTSGRTPGHPDTSLWLMNGNSCLRNIFAWSDPQAKWLVGNKWQQIIKESDLNLLWHGGQPVTTNQAGVADGDYWAAWQQLGFDLNSVIADPKFINPKKGDYRLQKDSPALKLGFRPLPLEKMGLYKSPERATWPVSDDGWREEHLKYPEGEPAQTARPMRSSVPVLTAALRATPPAIDGKVETPEWNWQPATTATIRELSMDPGSNGKQPTTAMVTYDRENLYVAVVSQVTDSSQLARAGGTWGADDGAEICLQDASATKPGPIFIVQGYPSGKTEAKNDAGAPAAAVTRLGQAVHYGANIGSGQWTGEWAIPWAALGIDPAKTTKLLFNIGVLKKTESEWIAWTSTDGAPWHLERAGKLVLVP
ncbi:MAG: right-handed parallel beta-helix repeat-containing protein [Armatimonadota bacterium]